MKFNKAYDLFETAIYIRLSREDGDKEESDSVGNQRKLLIEYLDEKEELVLHDVYVDDGYTGTNFNRPGFQKMMEDMEAGEINCVVVKDLSRFGRDYIDTGRYLERVFPEMGIRFISVTDGIDSHKQAYDMLLPIKNIFNEQYARDISKKIQATIKTKQKSGEFIGAFASYGYKKSPTDKNRLVVDEYAAEIVQRIFSMFLQGNGVLGIAKTLNKEGVLCPSEYKAVNGENYMNSKRLQSTIYWSYNTVRNILAKEMYVGNMVQGTRWQRMRSKQKHVSKDDWIVVKNTHEPIIDMETWEKTQSLLKERTCESKFQSNHNMFAGLLICGDCGRALCKNVWTHTDGSKAYQFNCGTYRRHGKHLCSPHSMRYDVLKDIVLSDLKTIVQDVGDLRDLVQAQKPSVSKMQERMEMERSKISIELERIGNLKKSVYEDYKEGLISKDEFRSYRADYVKKEELYLKQMETLESKMEKNDVADIFEMPWIKRLVTLNDIAELDRDIVVEMIEKIVVYEDKRIKIRYHFSDEIEGLFAEA